VGCIYAAAGQGSFKLGPGSQRAASQLAARGLRLPVGPAPSAAAVLTAGRAGPGAGPRLVRALDSESNRSAAVAEHIACYVFSDSGADWDRQLV
jgi:hypothetical protein